MNCCERQKNLPGRHYNQPGQALKAGKHQATTFDLKYQMRGNYFLTGGGSKSRGPYFEESTNLL